MASRFSSLYSALLPHERKKCDAFFAAQEGEKEKAMYLELKKLKPKSSESLALKVYGDKSKAANARQMRKNVTEKLASFIRTDVVPKDGGSSGIRRLLDFADFLIGRHSPALALEYLLEAQAEAKHYLAHDQLENIYHYKLKHAPVLGIDAKEAFKDWQSNHERYVSFMHLLSAQSILKQLLDEHRRDGIVPNQDELMAEFYESFTPNEEERRNPAFMLRLDQIFRRVMITTKDYWRIEPASKDIYFYLVEHDCFTQNDDQIKRTFLLNLSQSCYRNRNFAESEDFLKEVQRLLPVPIPRNDPDYVKLISQRSAIFIYTDRCEQAGELLRKHLYGPEPVENEVERINMQINLAVTYYCLEEFTRGLDILNKLDQLESSLSVYIGREGLYKKSMVHVILCWESGLYEEAEERLVNLIEAFRDFLEQELYKRALIFMEFVLRWFRDPDLINDPEFHHEVRGAKLGWGEREDIQAIFFFCWFRAHMLGKPFYPVFQARLKEDGENWDYPFSMK